MTHTQLQLFSAPLQKNRLLPEGFGWIWCICPPYCARLSLDDSFPNHYWEVPQLEIVEMAVMLMSTIGCITNLWALERCLLLGRAKYRSF